MWGPSVARGHEARLWLEVVVWHGIRTVVAAALVIMATVTPERTRKRAASLGMSRAKQRVVHSA
ncbi:hypothetical protein JCM33774_60220 [Actinophytocola sp. KF-1]